MRRFLKLVAIASACASALTLGVSAAQAATSSRDSAGFDKAVNDSTGSTPGKVTGGGWVNPQLLLLLSTTWDALSPLAVAPSAAGGTTKATFGFVAQCCSGSGNLEYDDHGLDVRIKAQSIDALFISSPGTSCPATPGSQHATFSGTATVFTSTSTTTEPFTVDVDDCGEPGSDDTLGIETTSYSHPPTTLMGGNIQIHK